MSFIPPLSFSSLMDITGHSKSDRFRRSDQETKLKSFSSLLWNKLPICYYAATRTGQTYPCNSPCEEHLEWWFLVGLGCLRLGYRKFVNRRLEVQFLRSVLGSPFIVCICPASTK